MKQISYQPGDFVINVWSGGKAVRTYKIVNSFINIIEENSSVSFSVNGCMVYVTGTVTIEQQKPSNNDKE